MIVDGMISEELPIDKLSLDEAQTQEHDGETSSHVLAQMQEQIEQIGIEDNDQEPVNILQSNNIKDLNDDTDEIDVKIVELNEEIPSNSESIASEAEPEAEPVDSVNEDELQENAEEEEAALAEATEEPEMVAATVEAEEVDEVIASEAEPEAEPVESAIEDELQENAEEEEAALAEATEEPEMIAATVEAEEVDEVIASEAEPEAEPVDSATEDELQENAEDEIVFATAVSDVAPVNELSSGLKAISSIALAGTAASAFLSVSKSDGLNTDASMKDRDIEFDERSIDDEYDYNADTFTAEYNDLPILSGTESKHEQIDTTNNDESEDFVLVDHVESEDVQIPSEEASFHDERSNNVHSTHDTYDVVESLHTADYEPINTDSPVKQRPFSSSPSRERSGSVFNNLHKVSPPSQNKGKAIRERIVREEEEDKTNKLQMHRERNTSSRDGFEKTLNERGRKISLEQAEQLYTRFMAHKERVEKKLKALREERDARDMEFTIYNKKISPEDAAQVFERLYNTETFSTSLAKNLVSKTSHTMPMTPMSVDSTFVETQELIQEAENFEDMFD